MAISAEFLVNGEANPAAHSVAYGATVTMTLLSTTGANSIVWEVLGSSHTDVVFPTLTLSGTPNGQTCTFTMVSDPGGIEGRSLLVRCTVTDSSGAQSRQSAVVGVQNGSGLIPISAGEEQERSLTHGWAPVVNQALAAVGGGGDVIGPGSATTGNLPKFASGTGKTLSDSGVAAADVILRTGAVAFTADQAMGSHKITGLTNGGTGTQDAATVAQVEALIAASTSNVSDWKQSVRAATTANITLSGAQTIDGISVIAGDRVLVKNQTTGSQNGIYVAASGAWSRATDADVSSEVTCGLAVMVEEGTVAGGKPYILTTANPITLGTTSLTFTQLSSAVADGTTITSSGGTFSVATNGVGNSQIRQGAACSVIGRSANSTGNVADISATPGSGAVLRESGNSVGFGTIATAGIANAAVTGAKLVQGTAAGQELLWDGSNYYLIGRKTGTALGDASVTIQYTTAAQYIWPAATNTTANRTITLGTTSLSSAPNAGVGAIINVYLLKAGYANSIAFVNGGAGAGTLFTLAASYTNPIAVSFFYDGTNWALAGWEDLGTVTAA